MRSQPPNLPDMYPRVILRLAIIEAMALQESSQIIVRLRRRGSAIVRRLEQPGFTECWGPVTLLTIIGIALFWWANSSVALKAKKLDGILTNIGTGFIAAAVLTGSIELQAQRKRNQFIDEAVLKIGSATADSLLQEFAPDRRIFTEIKETIFNKGFFRTNYSVRARLTYHSDPGYLVFRKNIAYSIKNTSTTDRLEYSILMSEEKEMDSLYPDSTQILHASYAISADQEGFNSEDAFEKIDIEKHTWTEDTSYFKMLKIKFPVSIDPDCYLHVKLISSVIVPVTDKYVFVSMISSTGLTFEITEHPAPIQIIALPIHPNDTRLKVDASDDHMIRWKILDGMLPGQGLLIRWMPTPDQRFLSPPVPPGLGIPEMKYPDDAGKGREKSL
jgi:hypothetical protein